MSFLFFTYISMHNAVYSILDNIYLVLNKIGYRLTAPTHVKWEEYTLFFRRHKLKVDLLSISSWVK